MKILTISFFQVVAKMLYVYGGQPELETDEAIEWLRSELKLHEKK